jgi:signal transduction histidine kinase/ligand-binding sensor domain-containing protein
MALALVAVPLAAERLPVRSLTTDDGLPRDHLVCARSDARGFVWFCTADGLVRFDGQVARTFGRNEGLDPPGIRSFLKASDGRYWIGGDAGLFEFHPAGSEVSGRFTAVRRADGQPTGSINGLAESRDHTIWCAGGRGLHRLTPAPGADVIEVDVGLPRGSESDRIVHAVLEDERGTLWAGAGSGLYARRPDGAITRITTRDGLPVNQVRALALDAAGRLWAATRAGLALVDRDAVGSREGRVVRDVYGLDDGLPNDNIHALHADGDTLWVGTSRGAAETTLTPDGALRVIHTLTGANAFGIVGDAHGDIWVATRVGAWKLSRGGFTTYTTEDGLPTSIVASLFENRAGEVCATTLVSTVELSCFDGRRFRRRSLGGLRKVSDQGWGWSQLTLQDRRGRWWIPTGEGLWQFAAGPASSLASAAPVAVHDVRAGLGSNNVFRIFEDTAGGIWVATFAEDRAGLARVEPETGSLHVFGAREGLPADLTLVHAFAEDGAGRIWIGLELGRLLRYRAGRFEEIPVQGPGSGPHVSAEYFASLLVDRRGRLWIASSVAGLGRVDDPGAAVPAIRWFGTAQGLSSDTAWALAEHESGDLFVGTARGVDRINPDTERVLHYSADDGVPRGEIKGALRDRQGNVWFATTAGVARLAPSREQAPEPPLTLVTAVRVAGVPLPLGADGATHVGAIQVPPGNRRLEIDFVSPAARAADGLRYQHQLEGIDVDWTTTDARTVALAGAAPGDYRFLVRAALASGVVGEPARVEFVVLAPLWRRWWFVALAATAATGLVFAFHRARVRRLLAVERVRSRIAADLHDGVGAGLSRIALLSEVVRRQVEPVVPAAVPALTSIAENARGVIDDVSDAVWLIDPRLDSLQHLIVRVRTVAADLFDGQRIAWRLEAPAGLSALPLSPEQRRHLYLILKESLTNVVRHARATRVDIAITRADHRLRLEVADDGAGIDAGGPPPPAGGGRGLANMRARAAALGGTLAVAAGSGGKGTRVTLEMPAPRPA